MVKWQGPDSNPHSAVQMPQASLFLLTGPVRARVTFSYLGLSTRTDLSLVAGSALDGGNQMGLSHLTQAQEGTTRRS